MSEANRQELNNFTQTDLYQILKPSGIELDIPSFLRLAHY